MDRTGEIQTFDQYVFHTLETVNLPFRGGKYLSSALTMKFIQITYLCE